MNPTAGRTVRVHVLLPLCNGAMVCLAIGINILPVFLTTLGEMFGGADGLTLEQLGRLAAASFLGSVLGIGAAGLLVDRCGAKLLMLLGNTVLATMLLVLAWAPDYSILLLGLVGLGFGTGVLEVVLSPVVAALHPTRRTAAMNHLHAYYCVGAALTVLAGTLALHVGIGWRGACLMLAPVPALLVVAFGPLTFPALVTVGERRRSRSLLREPWFLGTLFAMAMAGAVEMGVVQWMPAFSERELELPRWIGSSGLVVFTLGMAVARLLVGLSEARAKPFRVVLSSAVAALSLLVFGAWVPVPWIALGSLAIAGFAVGSLWPTVLAIAADRFPNGGGSMYAMLGAAGTIGAVVMPWLVGWVADESSLQWGLTLTAIAPAALVVMLKLSRRSTR